MGWPAQSMFPNTVVYRRITGVGATMNPPIAYSPRLDAAVLAGVSALSIRIQIGGNGRLLAGDTFTIAGDVTTYTVTAPVGVTVTGSGVTADTLFANVPFTPVLVLGAAKAAVVTLAFLADTTVDAQVVKYPAHLIDGISVMTNDLQVGILGSEIAFTPNPADKIVFHGESLSIVRAMPNYFNGALRRWDIQTR